LLLLEKLKMTTYFSVPLDLHPQGGIFF